MNIYTHKVTRIELSDEISRQTLSFDVTLPEQAVRYMGLTAAEIGLDRLGNCTQKVRAIKIVREAFKCGLKEAKLFVEEAMEEMKDVKPVKEYYK